MLKSKVSSLELSPNQLIFAIRIRGLVDVSTDVQDTLRMLRLIRVNIGVLLRLTPPIKGMLQKCKDHIAWGPIDEKNLTHLIQKRGRLTGNKHITDEYLAEKVRDFPNIKKLALGIYEGKIRLKDINGFKPVFRMHPPRGGHRGGIKIPFNSGGTLGYVGNYMDVLIQKML